MFTGKLANLSKAGVEQQINGRSEFGKWAIVALWGVSKEFDSETVLGADDKMLRNMLLETREGSSSESWKGHRKSVVANHDHMIKEGAHWTQDAFSLYKQGHIYRFSTKVDSPWRSWLSKHGVEAPRQPNSFAEISECNIKALRNETQVVSYEFFLYNALRDMAWSLQYNSDYLSKILSNGCFYSLEELGRKGLASSNYTTTMDREAKNTDYVFFSMTPSPPCVRQARYGHGTFFCNVQSTGLLGQRPGAWISLHEQVEPYPKNQELHFDHARRRIFSVYEGGQGSQRFRTGSFEIVNMKITFKYPQTKTERTVGVFSEIYAGPHIHEAIALTTIRELRSMGGQLYACALDLTRHRVAGSPLESVSAFLKDLVAALFRIEAKFPVCYVINPNQDGWEAYCADWEDRSGSPPSEVARISPSPTQSPPPPPPPPPPLQRSTASQLEKPPPRTLALAET